MSGIQYSVMNISQFCSSCAFAAAATVFYKKTFREDKLLSVGALSFLGLFLEKIEAYPMYCGVGIFASLCFLWYTAQNDNEWFKTAIKKDFFIMMFLAILDARIGLLPIAYWKNIRIFAAAIPQFLRKPLWLKTKLQDIRSKLGPIYILYVARYVLTRGDCGPEWLRGVANIAMISSVIAGVVFRPDNPTMLDLMGYKTKPTERRFYHRNLMICSFSCCALLTIADFFFRHTSSV